MAGYTQEELGTDWEFKVVQSDRGAFRDPQVLSALIEEETRAGWVMLEKFDDSRVRFKRPRSARARDAFLPAGVDPYRTQYGAPVTRNVALVSVLLGLALMAVAIGFVLRGNDMVASTSWMVVSVVTVLATVINLLFAVKAKR